MSAFALIVATICINVAACGNLHIGKMLYFGRCAELRNTSIILMTARKKELRNVERRLDNQPIGEVIAAMYRSILPDKKWENFIANMEPSEYKDETGDPIEHVTNPEKQLAHVALKDYGPL